MILSHLRPEEFGRLDRTGQVYLDFTGSALPAASLVRGHAHGLLRSVLGNPHSNHPASQRATRAVDQARRSVLAFFDADPAAYQAIFTANATAAIRLVAEAFPFGGNSRLVLSADNHNSMNGIREYAARAGAEVTYLPLDGELRMSRVLELPAPAGSALFGYPAQSNFSGVQHHHGLIAQAQRQGYTVLLDAAAFAPSNSLSLREYEPDFVAVSFYKMLGYPTGVGALIAKRSALATLVRPWFSGGTVDYVSVQHARYQLRADEGAFEDGTPAFGALSAVTSGLRWLRQIGMEAIHAHVEAMTTSLLERLLALRHSSGAPMVVLYGPESGHCRGGTVTFNLLDPDGRCHWYESVVELAGQSGISLRGGCFCNPGAAEHALGFDPERTAYCLDRAVSGPFSLPSLSRCLDGAPVGAVRASAGLPTNHADLDALERFLASLRDQPALQACAEPISHRMQLT